MASPILPLWKDYYVNLGTRQQYEWYLFAPNNIGIYHGIAYRRPGETAVKVKVNDLCASWMRTPEAKAASSALFRVTNSNGATIESFSFLYDWSYEPDHNGTIQGMSAPISVRLSGCQLLTFSLYGKTVVSGTLHLANGGTRTASFRSNTEAYYESNYGFGFALPYGQPHVHNFVIRLDGSSMSDVVAIEINGIRYDIDDKCSRYALYYMNAYGGWETLLLRGRVSFSESYQRRTYSKDYDNGDMTARGDVNFMNEADTDVALRTGWLTDEGAANIHHLTGSTWVYLHDMDEGTFIPLVLTDSSVDKKSYRGEGAQLVSYVVNARVAREMMRL